MTATETTALIDDNGKHPFVASVQDASKVSLCFLVIQLVLVAFFLTATTYDSEEDYDIKQYITFRDIMAMLLLGFGYLMTFLKHYGLGAVGFAMILSVLSMEINVAVELLCRFMMREDGKETSLPLPVSVSTLIDAEFSAAALMITLGAVIGFATPLQLLIVCMSEAFFYSFNKVFLVFGVTGAEDVGGSMTIHMFGAYFGLAVSKALGGPKDAGASPEPDKVSDVMALIGTTILWVFWPSFVGATETGVPVNHMRCVINTIVALLASTTVTFYLSQILTHERKFNPVHVANATLAGGVAIGSSGRLNIGPGGAAVTGLLAGMASVYGYVFSSPYLEGKWNIYDTCGVGNLHGYPSVVGGLLSVIFVALDSDAEFLEHDRASQMLRQFLGVVGTLAVAMASGYATGLLIKPLKNESATPSYQDSAWWHLEY